MAVTVTQVIDDVVAKLQGVQSLNPDAIFYVYTDKEFLDKIDHYQYPMVGVWYEGMFQSPNDKSSFSMSADLIVNIFVVGAPSEFSTIVEDKNSITQVLDDIRTSIKLSKSPTGHNWKFLSEAPYPIDADNNFVYIQRWQTPIILV